MGVVFKWHKDSHFLPLYWIWFKNVIWAGVLRNVNHLFIDIIMKYPICSFDCFSSDTGLLNSFK